MKRIILNIVVFIIIIIILVLYFKLCNPKPDSVSLSIITGIIASLIVAIVQYIINFGDLRILKKYEDLGIKEVKTSRDDRQAYFNLINRAQNRLWVMGVSATRLVEDFADPRSDQQDRKVIISKATTGVQVRILIADKNYLSEDNRHKFESLEKVFKSISNETNIEIRVYKHEPNHSIFVVDDLLIIGPVFKHKSSRDTSCVVVDGRKPFALDYLTAFEKEWDEGVRI